MEENSIVLPHSWHIVNNSFIIGIKPDVAIHKTIMICLLLGVPPITVSLHLFMIYLLMFSTKKHKYTNIFYKIVVATSFSVIYWAWYFFYQGMCQLLGYSLFGEIGNIIVASIAQYLFYVCMNMNLLIAMNRFSAVVFKHNHNRIFKPINGVLYIVIIYLGSAVLNIPGFMFLTKYYPELGTFNYFHKPSETFLKTSIFIEMGVVYAIHVAIFILYAWSFMSYKSMKCMTSQHKKERRLLIQAFISGSPCFILMTFHHLIHFPLLEVLAGELCVGIDPVVYMWFNKDIRADFLEVAGLKFFTKRFFASNFSCGTDQYKPNAINAGTSTMFVVGTTTLDGGKKSTLTTFVGGSYFTPASDLPTGGGGAKDGTHMFNVQSRGGSAKKSNKISNGITTLPSPKSTIKP